MSRHAEDERHALAQTLRQAGPSAPTLCGEWRTAQLAAHLVRRERTLIDGLGRLPIPPLQRRAEALVQREAAERPYAELVDDIDRGPSWRDVRGPVPVAWLWALPPVRETVDLLEYLVHHEDVRRAGEDWEPRALSADMQAAVLQRLRLVARATLRSVPVGLVLSAPGVGEIRSRLARPGAPVVTVTGAPVELAMVAFGRIPQASVQWTGAPADIEAVRGADISL